MSGNQTRPAVDHWTMRSTASWTVPPNGRRGIRSNVARVLVGAGITLAMAVAAAACGDDDSTATSDATTGDAISAAARSGEELSRSQGCAGCHGRDFDGGAGPGWIGLAGSEVVLTDGTTVIADDEYLTAAIADPSAQLVEGYNLRMPANNLTDAEVADIVAFINTLADE